MTPSPGPWAATEENNVWSADDKQVCSCRSRPGCGMVWDEARISANAQLIAATPMLLSSLCWALRQLQGDTGTGDSHWSQFPEYVAAVEVARSLGGDVAHSQPVSVCDHYRHKELQVVIDWDGQNTIELVDEILQATGESESLPTSITT